MKERNLAGHKKYSNFRFDKIPEPYETYNEEDENCGISKEEYDDIIKLLKRFYSKRKNIRITGNEKLYRIMCLYSDYCRFQKEHKNDKDMVWIYNNTYIYFIREEDMKLFLKERKDYIVSLYDILSELLTYREAFNSKILRKVIITSSEDRFIQNYKITETHDLYEKLLQLFKSISFYRLHCYTRHKFTKNKIVIQLIHASKQKYKLKKQFERIGIEIE